MKNEEKADQLLAEAAKHYAAFCRCHENLLKIRDHRLYKPEYETFEEYALVKWGITPERFARCDEFYQATRSPNNPFSIRVRERN